MLNQLSRMAASAIGNGLAFVLFLLLFSALAAFGREGILLAGGLHWVLGVGVAAAATLSAFAFAFFTWWAMRPDAPAGVRAYWLIPEDGSASAPLTHRFPVAATTAMTCAAVGLAAVALGDISLFFAREGVMVFEGVPAGGLDSDEPFVRLYLWHAVDLLPLLDVWDTYGVRPSVSPGDFGSRTLVLLFRTGIVGFCVTVVAEYVVYLRTRARAKP